MGKDRHVYIETISAQFDVRVGTVNTIIRNWRCGRFARSLSQGCSRKIRKKDVVMTVGRWLSWSIQIPQFFMLWWPSMKAGFYWYDPETKRQSYQWKHTALPDPRRPDKANPPTNFLWSLFDSTGIIYMQWVPTGQIVNKEYCVKVFRKRFRRKRPAL